MERCSLLKIIIGVYLFPACVLLFVFITNGSSVLGILPYLLPYFISTVAISFYFIKRNNLVERDIPTLSARISNQDLEGQNDAPPSYLDATKDPPPYSLLKYYKNFIEWRPFKNRFGKMNQSYRFPRKVSSDMNPEADPSGRNPPLKRVLSSPV